WCGDLVAALGRGAPGAAVVGRRAPRHPRAWWGDTAWSDRRPRSPERPSPGVAGVVRHRPGARRHPGVTRRERLRSGVFRVEAHRPVDLAVVLQEGDLAHAALEQGAPVLAEPGLGVRLRREADRKSTRLNSSHVKI